MSLYPPPPPKQIPWFTLAVILVLLGAGILVLYAASGRRVNTASPGQSTPGFYTAAADTLNALQATSVSTPFPPTDLPTELPSMTAFAQYIFTPPATSSPAPASSENYCDNSIYISDVTIPDGTVMSPGTSFVKTWAFQNTGSCTWNTNYQLIFISGDRLGGAATNLTQSVAPYQQIQASVSLTAPLKGGTYLGYWRLANDQGNGFGNVVFVKIVVSNAAATGTLTATPAHTSTPTSSPAATATPTATSAVTATTPATATASPTFTATATTGQ